MESYISDLSSDRSDSEFDMFDMFGGLYDDDDEDVELFVSGNNGEWLPAMPCQIEAYDAASAAFEFNSNYRHKCSDRSGYYNLRDVTPPPVTHASRMPIVEIQDRRRPHYWRLMKEMPSAPQPKSA